MILMDWLGLGWAWAAELSWFCWACVGPRLAEAGWRGWAWAEPGLTCAGAAALGLGWPGPGLAWPGLTWTGLGWLGWAWLGGALCWLGPARPKGGLARAVYPESYLVLHRNKGLAGWGWQAMA